MKVTALHSIAKKDLVELRKQLVNISEYGYQGQQEPQTEKTLHDFVKTMNAVITFLREYFKATQGLELVSDKDVIRACNLPKEHTDVLIEALVDVPKITGHSMPEKNEIKKIMVHLTHYVEAMELCLKSAAVEE